MSAEKKIKIAVLTTVSKTMDWFIVDSMRNLAKNGYDVTLVTDLYNVLLYIVLINVANSVDIQKFPRSTEYLVLSSAIVISRSNNNGHIRVSLANFNHCLREHSLYST